MVPITSSVRSILYALGMGRANQRPIRLSLSEIRRRRAGSQRRLNKVQAEFDGDRLIKALRDRFQADGALAERIADRVRELERQRDQARRAYREANRLLHRLDTETVPYQALSRSRRLRLLEALLRPTVPAPDRERSH